MISNYISEYPVLRYTMLDNVARACIAREMERDT
jgi:hypothetical protein